MALTTTVLPRLFSPYDAPMWESINQKCMKLQWCPESEQFRYPPGPACPISLSMEYEWRAISGLGRIISWTVFHKTYLPAYPAPHLVIAVQLKEGPILVSNMAYSDLERLRLDLPVRMIYADHPDGHIIPSFVVDEGS